jgi:hypothetical protein
MIVLLFQLEFQWLFVVWFRCARETGNSDELLSELAENANEFGQNAVKGKPE